MMHHLKKYVSHPGLGLFLIRLGIGVIFVNHGVMKLMNMGGTVSFFDTVIPGPAGVVMVLAWVVALIETLGGFAMILGVYTRIVGWLLAGVMLFAIIFVKSKMPFVAGEIDLLLLVASLGIAIGGPGKLALCAGCGKMAGKCSCVAGTCDNCDACAHGCTGHEA